MYRHKILIAASSEEFQSAMLRELDPYYRVVCCSRGEEALEQARIWEPDVLVLDMSLSGLGGLQVLRGVDALERRPQVLAIVPMDDPILVSALEGHRVAHAMRKPAPVPIAAERVRELIARRVRMTRGCAVRMLTVLGLPSGRQGYRHLLTGLPDLVEHRDQQLSNELYATMARESRTTQGSVEKAIRDTIRAGWKSGDRELWQQYFPGITRCPRNKDFLFRLADLISEELRCG